MGDIVKRLRVSVDIDAVNGDSFERHVCEKQMSEAAKEIESLRGHIEEQQKLINEQEKEIERLHRHLSYFERKTGETLIDGENNG